MTDFLREKIENWSDKKKGKDSWNLKEEQEFGVALPQIGASYWGITTVRCSKSKGANASRSQPSFLSTAQWTPFPSCLPNWRNCPSRFGIIPPKTESAAGQILSLDGWDQVTRQVALSHRFQGFVSRVGYGTSSNFWPGVYLGIGSVRHSRNSVGPGGRHPSVAVARVCSSNYGNNGGQARGP